MNTDNLKSEPYIMDIKSFTEVADVDAAKYILSLSKEELLHEFPANREEVVRGKKTDKQIEIALRESAKQVYSLSRSVAKWIVEHGGDYTVNYKYQSGIEGIRLQAVGVSIFKLGKKLKCFLAQEEYIDLDIQNCYPVCLKKILDGHPTAPDYKYLKMYVKDRAKILKDHGLTKELVTIPMMTDNPIVADNDFLTPFTRELKQIKKFLWDLNENPTHKAKAIENQKQKGYTNYKSSYMGYSLMVVENRMVQKLLKMLNPELSKILCYDGVMVADFEGDLVSINKSFEADGIVWVEKPTPCDDVPELPEDSYYNIKERYEKVHTYIKDQKCPIASRNDWGIAFQTLGGGAADAMEYGKDFFGEWLLDPHKQQKKRIDFVPLSPIQEENGEIGEEIFNTFQGFETKFDKGKVGYPKNQLFQTYLNALSSNRPEISQHIYNWVAHMVQKPSENPKTGLILTGVTGCGKTTLFKIITSMLGSRYTNTTSDPKQVFPSDGGDNTLMKNCLLVQLEETMGMQGKMICNRLKEFFSMDRLNIRVLYNSPYQQNNTVRLLINSNEYRPIPYEAAVVRRTTMMWIEKARSAEWFDELYDNLINDKLAMSELYHELLYADISDFVIGRCPTTKEQEEASMEEVSPLSQYFFDEFNGVASNHYNSEWISNKKGETYIDKDVFINNYREWLSDKNYESWKVNPSQVMREVKRLPGIDYKRINRDGQRFRALFITDPQLLSKYVETL